MAAVAFLVPYAIPIIRRGVVGVLRTLAVLDAERANAEASIGVPRRVVLAITRMATVGSGGRYPTTGTGRVAAAGSMLWDIAVLGTVTARLAS
jgi:voltage-gated potassium channel